MNHTAQYMQPAIGQQCMITMESLIIPCEVLDVKSSWGKIRLLVTPVRGEGQQWVEMERVSKAIAAMDAYEFKRLANGGESHAV